MLIILDEHYNVRISSLTLGYVGETNARTITFSGLDVVGAEIYKMRLKYPDGVEYDVQIKDGKYIVGGSILRMPCEVQAQILACKAVGDTYEFVKKSNVFKLEVKPSLGDEPAPVPSYEETLELLELLNNKLVTADFADFPAAGIEDAVYAAKDRRMFYAWSAAEGRYLPYSTGGESGTGRYEELLNLPSLNGIEIIGDKSDEDYGIIAITNTELEKILK